MCKGKCTPSMIAKVLVIIGGINWGLVGLGMLMGKTSWNIVNMILGTMPTLEAIIYLLVGVSAVIMIFGCKCKKCTEACATCSSGPQKMEGNM
ncbi:MAG: DUF378 domain-containing protein [Candidatus Nomurabacteria bacterium]|nr:DUF378 domain-containing protein [Candidatus Nomurabacteria bacterium]